MERVFLHGIFSSEDQSIPYLRSDPNQSSGGAIDLLNKPGSFLESRLGSMNMARTWHGLRSSIAVSSLHVNAVIESEK